MPGSDNSECLKGLNLSMRLPPLLTSPAETQRALSLRPLPDQWEWHERCPENLIPEHPLYQRFHHE